MFCFGCGSSSVVKGKTTYAWDMDEVSIVWAFECDFPKDKRQDVRNAFVWWDEQTPIDLFHETECYTGEQPFDVQVGVMYRDVQPKNRSPGMRGLTHQKSAVIDGERVLLRAHVWFWKRWPSDKVGYREAVARHEVGHALGFHHIPYKKCLMFRFTNPNEEYKGLCSMERRELMRVYGPSAVPIGDK